ncbi:MAG: glycerol-3-phosphate dehydrogenase/oxidase [Acidobacteriia bacterium]|nr:glycerol-3-phosphate dehydrogenase/oxidase [Terriglobia bacterium]
MSREERLEAVSRRPEVSVLIVGGGINGLGLLRELALQGVDTLLIEKSDFCSGASSASTRIIHGGLRYLENREFRLVKEALRERNRLLKNAPHYVRPLPTTIPVFSWADGLFPALAKFLGFTPRPYSRGALLFKIGLSFYDLFAGSHTVLPRHHFQSRRASLALRPHLHPGIVSTAIYYDAWISYPERLGVELALDAESQSSDARAVNYVRAQSARGDTVVLADEISGKTYEVKPRLVVNATGAWIDFTNRALQRETQYIGGTKGSHIVIDHPELLAATQGQMLYFENADGRICLFYPFYGKVIAGSTDIPVWDPETAWCEDNEVEYILESVRQVFPTLHIDRSHIVFRFCGVRPLPRSDSATPGTISRDHTCAVIPAGEGINFQVYSLIGGKWTTFRAFGEQVADRILRDLGRPRRAGSADLPIGGGKNYPKTAADRLEWLASLAAKTGLAMERLEVLLDRYGTRAEEVAQWLISAPDQDLRFLPLYSRREIQFIASQESVVHLDDLILRRTLMALLGQLRLDLLEELANVLAPALDWSQERTRLEIERTVRLLEQVHGVKFQ